MAVVIDEVLGVRRLRWEMIRCFHLASIGQNHWALGNNKVCWVFPFILLFLALLCFALPFFFFGLISFLFLVYFALLWIWVHIREFEC